MVRARKGSSYLYMVRAKAVAIYIWLELGQ